jgi:nickel-dependent lactate racemase
MMHSEKYEIPYGRSVLKFSVPGDRKVDVAVSKQPDPISNPEAAVRESVRKPLGCKPLTQTIRPGDRVCIAYTDITRASPDFILVPALLSELESAGIRDDDITLLCATGMHRPSTREEKVAKLGLSVVSRYRILDNEPQNPSALVNLGMTAGGVPVYLHRAAVEADHVLATGIVEPHQYAGYSGGRKTLAVGAAGESLIAYTHGPAFIDHPGTRLGRIEGNPFHEAIAEAARLGGLKFIVNVVLDENKRIIRVAAGDPEAAFRELVSFARSVYEVSIPHSYDIAVAGVGFPKDSNLYQASRAASYLFFAPISVIRPGGFCIIPARCEEGAGMGIGERRFCAAMKEAPDVRHILDEARRNGYPPGQQRAFIMAKVLEQMRVVIVGSECPELVAACKMIPAATMEDALALAEKELGPNSSVLMVPHALLTLPIIG